MRQSNRYHGYSRENGRAILGFLQKGPPQLRGVHTAANSDLSHYGELDNKGEPTDDGHRRHEFFAARCESEASLGSACRGSAP